MKILGIETSCDETGIAIYDSNLGLLSHAIHSQIETHAKYGGVVPELASRDHITKLIPLIQKVLNESAINSKDLSAIAYTNGPGLIGALLVGASFAKSLALAWDLPAIGIHHMEGHLLASFLEKDRPKFPFIALLVSGGHTQLYRVDNFGSYMLLGETLDDAAGEAFDKIGKLLGLPYPGGPQIEKLASAGNPNKFNFPRPMISRPGLDFSFSGLKTFAMNTYREFPENKADIARALQDAVIDTISIKCLRALKNTSLSSLVIAGGVGANLALREKINKLGIDNNFKVYYPQPQFCTDNGAMIAYAGYEKHRVGFKDIGHQIQVKPKWPLMEAKPYSHVLAKDELRCADV